MDGGGRGRGTAPRQPRERPRGGGGNPGFRHNRGSNLNISGRVGHDTMVSPDFKAFRNKKNSRDTMVSRVEVLS